jgi:hypothetical protein
MNAVEQQTAADVLAPYQTLIESALQYCGGTHIYEDIVQAVELEQMMFWRGENSCIVTEVADFPRKRVLHVFLAAGDLSELKEMEPSLQFFAKALECDAITLSGRSGWERSLVSMGYKKIHTTLGKDLDGSEQ